MLGSPSARRVFIVASYWRCCVEEDHVALYEAKLLGVEEKFPWFNTRATDDLPILKLKLPIAK